MKKTENILQRGYPQENCGKKDQFGTFWCKLTIIITVLGDLKQELPVRKQIRPRPSGFELN